MLSALVVLSVVMYWLSLRAAARVTRRVLEFAAPSTPPHRLSPLSAPSSSLLHPLASSCFCSRGRRSRAAPGATAGRLPVERSAAAEPHGPRHDGEGIQRDENRCGVVGTSTRWDERRLAVRSSQSICVLRLARDAGVGQGRAAQVDPSWPLHAFVKTWKHLKQTQI
jgi:hypothetical protein